eukprot:GHVT01103916.1.p1 GENE.GHVT01103916.1~~GHVT01103916.1.p1  ORF type:complete len:236 (-),score=47.43 GHVT01103916.1:1029-1736(-)
MAASRSRQGGNLSGAVSEVGALPLMSSFSDSSSFSVKSPPSLSPVPPCFSRPCFSSPSPSSCCSKIFVVPDGRHPIRDYVAKCIQALTETRPAPEADLRTIAVNSSTASTCLSFSSRPPSCPSSSSSSSSLSVCSSSSSESAVTTRLSTSCATSSDSACCRCPSGCSGSGGCGVPSRSSSCTGPCVLLVGRSRAIMKTISIAEITKRTCQLLLKQSTRLQSMNVSAKKSLDMNAN